ncbi:MAG: flagellar hook-basal body complex protein FliE, partial [bacterium]
ASETLGYTKMGIDQSMSIGPVRPSSPTPFETDPIKKEDPTFGEILKNAISATNDRMIDADTKTFQLAMGEIKDIHEVTIAMEKASLSLQLTLEIRDRLMEAYNTIMRTAM